MIEWKQKLYLKWREDLMYVKVIKYRISPQFPREERYLVLMPYMRHKQRKNLDRTRKTELDTTMQISCNWSVMKAPFHLGLFPKYVEQYRSNFPDDFHIRMKHFEWEDHEKQAELIKEFVQMHINTSEKPFETTFHSVKEFEIVPVK